MSLPSPKNLPNENIKLPYFFIGDAAFSLKKNFITPYSRLNEYSVSQRVFNYRLSRARRIIESAFGILTSKWKILKAPLAFKVEKTDMIVLSCLCLHNFIITSQIIDNNEKRYTVDDDNSENLADDDGYSTNEDEYSDNEEVDNDIYNNIDGITIRQILTNYFTSPEGSVLWQWGKI